MSTRTPDSGANVASWVTVQPARIRALVDPSWSPVRAAVVLASHHEQEAIVSLSKWLTDLFRFRLVIDVRDVVRETFGIPVITAGLEAADLTREHLAVILGGLRSLILVLEAELETKTEAAHAN